MKHFFTSDLHFFHKNIIRYCGRTNWMNEEELQLFTKNEKFQVSIDSVNRMNEGLIDNINNVVGENDVLWFLGDWCFGTRMDNRLQLLKDKINCKNCHLIFGNHDIKTVISPFFVTAQDRLVIAIAEDGQYWIGEEYVQENKICKNAQKIILDHYPILSWNGIHKNWWMLHGHCHNTLSGWVNENMPNKKILDVGVDGHNYQPWSLEEIKEFMNKKHQHKAGVSNI